MKPILDDYMRNRRDFAAAGIEDPDRGFFVNVYRYNIGTSHEANGVGKIHPTRKEAVRRAKDQLKFYEDAKLLYRIRVIPKEPVPYAPVRPMPMYRQPMYPGPCMCQMQVMRGFR